MAISRAWNYYLLMAVAIIIALYLHQSKSDKLKEFLGLIIFLCSYYYLTKAPKESVTRDKKKHYRSNLSYAIDDLQSEKQFIPKQYRKLKNKMNQSFSKMKQKLGLKPKNWARGDGLHSIFSGSLFNLHHTKHAPQTVDMNKVRSSILDSNQSMAFNALFTWGIFEGAELSILNELCSNATLLKRKKGDFLFKHDSPNANDFLYILKTGTCSVVFPQTQAGDEGGSKSSTDRFTDTSMDTKGNTSTTSCDEHAGDVVLEISDGRVIASVADVLAWLIRSDTPRKISIRCTADCEVVAIPSPRGRLTTGGESAAAGTGEGEQSGQREGPGQGQELPVYHYQSRLHLTSFARIARMLLIRFNRTTNTTALFYLGLAEHMVPKVPPIPVPGRLQEICALACPSSSSSRGKLALSSLDPCLYPECLELIQQMIGSLLGIAPEEVVLPTEQVAAVAGEGAGAGDGRDKSKSTVDVSGELSFIPPPVAFSRTKSFDSIMDSDSMVAGGSPLYPPSPSDVAGRTHRSASFGRQTRSGLRFMSAGQSLLDIEDTPGLYVIISGRVEVLFCGYDPAQRGGGGGGSTGADGAGALSTAAKNITPSFLSRHRFITPTVFSDGDCLGQIALLAGNSAEWYGQQKHGSVRRPVLHVKAETDTWLLKVSMFTYEKALADHPEVIFHFSERMISVLPPMIRLFDFCTKWVNLRGGDDLVQQGEQSQGKLYIVLFGTLLCLVNKDSTPSSENSAGLERGAEMEVEEGEGTSSEEDVNGDRGGEGSSQRNRRSHARRDDEASSGYSQIGHTASKGYTFGRGTLIGDTQLLTGAPYKHTVRAIRQAALSEVPAALLEYLALHFPSILTHIARNVSHKQHIQQKHLNPNTTASSSSGVTSKSIMLTPVTGSVPLDLVSSTLKTCLGHCANKVQLITSADAAAVFGGVLDGLSEYELILTVGSWMHQIEQDNDIVLYQADWQLSAWNRLCIINCDEILLVANTLDSHETESMEKYLHSQSKLIPKTLLMLYTNPSPDLKPSGTRNWIEAREGSVDRHVHVRLHSNNQMHDTINYRSDFNRLARILTNTAVGVVLGGGGARGISHLGILQALEERNIPVDMIGGTSIGSFVGGLYAFENGISTVNPIAESWALKMNSYWFYLQDLTLPITSYFNGHNFTSAIRQVFERRKIEDMWLNYYCVTTDLTSHTERVHVNGTASRYIRASMSLANFLPPLCDVDPVDRKCHYLVDGGYVNTVPIDVMRNRFGAKIIIAVDVSGDWNMNASQSYGDSLNGLSVWASRWNPFAEKIQNVPTMADIANQLAFVSACRQVERVKGLADLYILPPVNGYSTLEFGAFDTLKEIGLSYGGKEIDKWLQKFDPGEGFKSAWFQGYSSHKSQGGGSASGTEKKSRPQNSSSLNLFQKSGSSKTLLPSAPATSS